MSHDAKEKLTIYSFRRILDRLKLHSNLHTLAQFHLVASQILSGQEVSSAVCNGIDALTLETIKMLNSNPSGSHIEFMLLWLYHEWWRACYEDGIIGEEVHTTKQLEVQDAVTSNLKSKRIKAESIDDQSDKEDDDLPAKRPCLSINNNDIPIEALSATRNSQNTNILPNSRNGEPDEFSLLKPATSRQRRYNACALLCIQHLVDGLPVTELQLRRFISDLPCITSPMVEVLKNMLLEDKHVSIVIPILRTLTLCRTDIQKYCLAVLLNGTTSSSLQVRDPSTSTCVTLLKVETNHLTIFEYLYQISCVIAPLYFRKNIGYRNVPHCSFRTSK